MKWRRLASALCVLAIGLSSQIFAAQPTIREGETLTAVLSGAITTSNPTFSIDYYDLNTSSDKSAVGSLSGVTVKTMLTGNTPFKVTGVTICNIDTVAQTVTIAKTNSAGTSFTLSIVTLQANDVLSVNDFGIKVTDSSGQVKNGGGSAVTPFALPAHDWRKTDGVTINPVTAATTNFGVVYGTDGTDFPHLETIDSKAATTAVVSRIIWKLPPNYVPGSAVTIRARAGMKTTIADNSAATTVVFTAYSNLGVANTGSANLVTTAAQTINSLTAANKDFTVTPTGLVAGQDLHIKMTLTVTDAATGTAVIGTINHVEVQTTTYR